MLAGKLVIEYLSNTTDAIFHFPDTHPALMISHSLPIIENGQLNSKIFDKRISKITVLTDAIPSLYIEPIDLSILLEIPEEIEINLVIDESHSIGIIGNEWQNNLKKGNINIIRIASLGKALGISGGAIFGNSSFISKIRNQDCFIGASGMNPAFLETYCNSQDVYLSQLRKLKENLRYIDTHFTNRELYTFKSSYPNIYFDEVSISNKLFNNRIITTSFNYTNSSEKLNRIVINANHTYQDLEQLVLQLNSDY